VTRETAAVAVLFLALSASAVHARQAPSAKPDTPAKPVNHDAQVLVDFTDRVKQYVALRQKAGSSTASLKKTDDGADISAAQTALATKIRAARAGAKPGDIFTPEIAIRFKALLHPESTAATKASIKDDNPGPIPFKVNEPYPDKATLSTVPPNVLEALPKLPDGIEYRFVGKHLILRDARANMVIDYIVNAMP
jgi:hypothetical protein